MTGLLSGIEIGILELFLFWGSSFTISRVFVSLQKINTISYYWLMFTILTGMYEFTYVRNRKKVRRLGMNLLSKKKHVWTKEYELKTLLPWNLAKQFYAEYAAYADREYYNLKDVWSLLIEGSHGVQCGCFAFGSILSFILARYRLFLIFLTMSMSSQFMNSLLYMGEYFTQISDIDSVNYDTERFPCGRFLIKRPFMWINFFWLAMPTYVLTTLLL